MITEDYVSYGVAKLLKDKGFNESCNSFYYLLLDNGDYRYTISDFPYKNSCKYNIPSLARPTHQMTMKWLRKKHGFHISVAPYLNLARSRQENEKEVIWVWEIINIKSSTIIAYSLDGDDFNSCEEAVDAALKHCLTKLI